MVLFCTTLSGIALSWWYHLTERKKQSERHQIHSLKKSNTNASKQFFLNVLLFCLFICRYGLWFGAVLLLIYGDRHTLKWTQTLNLEVNFTSMILYQYDTGCFLFHFCSYSMISKTDSHIWFLLWYCSGCWMHVCIGCCVGGLVFFSNYHSLHFIFTMCTFICYLFNIYAQTTFFWVYTVYLCKKKSIFQLWYDLFSISWVNTWISDLRAWYED